MNELTCDVCGQPATVHATEIHDGKRVERHFCAGHAGDVDNVYSAAMAPGQMRVNGVVCASVQEAVMRGLIDNLRATANCIRRHGRMPASVEELTQGMALRGDFPIVEIGDAKLRGQLEYLDRLIAFCETHGRVPQTSDEMPPMPEE
jgi:hypothetical protein